MTPGITSHFTLHLSCDPVTQTLFPQEEQKRSPTHPEQKMVQSAQASLALSALQKEKEVGPGDHLQRPLRSQALAATCTGLRMSHVPHISL